LWIDWSTSRTAGIVSSFQNFLLLFIEPSYFIPAPPSSLCRLILISIRVGEEQREIMIFVFINAGTTVTCCSHTDVMDCMVPLLSSEDFQKDGTMESDFYQQNKFASWKHISNMWSYRYLYTQSVTVQLIM
jgi:hypothetical protein